MTGICKQCFRLFEVLYLSEHFAVVIHNFFIINECSFKFFTYFYRLVCPKKVFFIFYEYRNIVLAISKGEEFKEFLVGLDFFADAFFIKFSRIFSVKGYNAVFGDLLHNLCRRSLRPRHKK